MTEYEKEIVCDLAEYYHITDYRKVSPRTVYLLISGLREDSRFVMRLSGQEHSMDQIVNAMILDRLSVLCWQNTKDARKGRNKPKMLGEAMLKGKKESEAESFKAAEDFEAYRRNLLRKKQ